MTNKKKKDLRNHGDSPHDPRHDYTAMAEDVGAFLGEHGIEEPTIIGHSMGAKAAMALALRSPGLVRDVVAVDNAPVDAALGTDFGKYIRAMKRVEAAGVTSQKEADAIMAEVEEVGHTREIRLSFLLPPPFTLTLTLTLTLTSPVTPSIHPSPPEQYKSHTYIHTYINPPC